MRASENEVLVLTRGEKKDDKTVKYIKWDPYKQERR